MTSRTQYRYVGTFLAVRIIAFLGFTKAGGPQHHSPTHIRQPMTLTSFSQVLHESGRDGKTGPQRTLSERLPWMLSSVMSSKPPLLKP